MTASRRVDYLLDHCSLITGGSGSGPAAGDRQADLGLVTDAAVAIDAGVVVALGPHDEVAPSFAADEYTDMGGRVIMPGFVDAHTHPLWAGSRAAEFEMRVKGATYLEIMAAGGGIASTVRATRAADDEELLQGLMERLDTMMEHGSTTIEAKTGYGLDTEQELRQLDLLAEADAKHPVRIVRTFLGAHALPDEYRERKGEYVALVVDEMLPAVAERNPGIFADVFCEEGAFDLEETRLILERAAELGLRLKIHSDEFANLGCTGLAARMGAVSADHLAVTSRDEMEMMAKSGTVAVLLPGTSFGLGHADYAPARDMVSSGVAVALATDLNPGTCPCMSMQPMLALAARYMGLTPAESIIAATRNAACAVGCDESAGRVAEGHPADLIALTTTDYRDLSYQFGTNLVAGVIIGGRWTRPL